MSHLNKFNFGNTGPVMEIDTKIVIDRTVFHKLNSSGNFIRTKHNPMLLWKHHNEMNLRPLINDSLRDAREYLSKKMLEEVGKHFKK